MTAPHPVLDLLRAHRSIRQFKPDPIPEEHVIAAVEAGQAASTSSAVQAYHLIRVKDPAARDEIADLAGPQEKIRLAPEFFVVCGDTRRHRLAAERDGLAYDARLEAFLLAVIDATLFAEKMVIAFEALGYGICYIGGVRNDLPRLDRTLELPDGVYPLYGLCVGLPDQSPGIRPRLPLAAVMSTDRYPADAAMLDALAGYDERYIEYLTQRGAKPAGWSGTMAKKFSKPERTDLSSYYSNKGADLH